MKFARIAAIAAAVLALPACGKRVEVPPASVGKIMTADGYKEGIIPTSSFRLKPCYPGAACQRLVVLNASDIAISETMTLFMPKNKLNMTFVLQGTLTVNEKKFDEIYGLIRPQTVEGSETMVIERKTAYDTYAKQIILTEVREALSKYSIEEIMSSLDTVNAELNKVLHKSISEKTPFIPRFVGLADVQPPKIIVDQQESTAKRREMIAQEEAQLEVSKVQLNRELQEQAARRKVEVAKAESDAQVSRIQAESMTPAYMRYRELEILEQLAKSPNKVFVPTGSLNSIAVQTQIGK